MYFWFFWYSSWDTRNSLITFAKKCQDFRKFSVMYFHIIYPVSDLVTITFSFNKYITYWYVPHTLIPELLNRFHILTINFFVPNNRRTSKGKIFAEIRSVNRLTSIKCNFNNILCLISSSRSEQYWSSSLFGNYRKCSVLVLI